VKGEGEGPSPQIFWPKTAPADNYTG